MASVEVRAGRRGRWTVTISDRDEALFCESLAEARHVARSCAEARRPCEVVVHDAYERVLEYEVLPGPTGEGSA
jgi:hypothetical protein